MCIRDRYITFGTEADSLRAAKPKLERIEADILNNFKSLGVKTEPVSYTHLDVYKRQEHDSLTVRGNKWFRHSQSKGGYPIDFVMEFYGKSFPCLLYTSRCV